MIKDEFIAYLNSRPARLKKGVKLQSTTFRYVKALEKIIKQEFSAETLSLISNKNFFEMHDYSAFEIFKSQIIKDPYFITANHYGNGDLLASLNHYSIFLSTWAAQNIDFISTESIHQLAIKHSSTVPFLNIQSVIRNSPQRDIFVSTYAKLRALGYCQLCNKPAPFDDKNGKPFLESHHIVWLSQGGSDHIDNVVALCPNCHRKMHVLNELSDVEYLKKIIVQESIF